MHSNLGEEGKQKLKSKKLEINDDKLAMKLFRRFSFVGNSEVFFINNLTIFFMFDKWINF